MDYFGSDGSDPGGMFEGEDEEMVSENSKILIEIFEKNATVITQFSNDVQQNTASIKSLEASIERLTKSFDENTATIRAVEDAKSARSEKLSQHVWEFVKSPVGLLIITVILIIIAQSFGVTLKVPGVNVEETPSIEDTSHDLP